MSNPSMLITLVRYYQGGLLSLEEFMDLKKKALTLGIRAEKYLFYKVKHE